MAKTEPHFFRIGLSVSRTFPALFPQLAGKFPHFSRSIFAPALEQEK